MNSIDFSFILRNRFGQMFKFERTGDKTKITYINPDESQDNVSMIMPLRFDEVRSKWNRWTHDENIQNVFTELNADEREFLMTGLTPSEWDEMFANDIESYSDESENERSESDE
jgi:hypothetical protein